MPSALELPKISDLVKAFHDSVSGTKDKRADVRTGSAYDYIAGISGMIWSRESQRDQDLFRADYFDTATGNELTDRGLQVYGIPRVLDTFGTGLITVSRATTSGGAGRSQCSGAY